MADVAMPRLSDSMEEGTILKWLKSDGDEVEKGEELVEIETDKANMTYEADESGTLSIVAKEGDTLAVGETICSIGEGGGSSGGAEDAEDKGEEEEEEDSGDEESGDEEDSEDEESEEEEEESEEDKEKSEEDEREPVAEEETDEGEEDEGGGDEGEEKDGDGDGSEPAEEAKQEEEAEREPVATAEEDGDAEETQKAEAASSGGNGRTKASPVARRMARELGVELAALEGTGPGGRIVKADVEAAAGDGKGAADEDGREPAEDEEEKAKAKAEDEAGEDEASEDEGKGETAKDEGEAAEQKGEAAEAPTGKDDEKPKKKDEQPAKAKSGDAGTGRGETTTEELTRLQQTVARRMAESKATAPDFVMTCEVDMEAAVAFRAQLKVAAGEDPAPSFNDFVVKACAFALRAFPRANGAYRDGRFELYSRVNVGIAVAGQDALVVPTIFDADRKSLGAIARDARGLAERVREGKITPPELAGGTFTVSNLGMYGIKRFVAVINPPQAAILAVGEMTPRPVVHDGEIVVRPLLELTLSCDHRILYGADAAQFLGHIRERLENPVGLAL